MKKINLSAGIQGALAAFCLISTAVMAGQIFSSNKASTSATPAPATPAPATPAAADTSMPAQSPVATTAAPSSPAMMDTPSTLAAPTTPATDPAATAPATKPVATSPTQEVLPDQFKVYYDPKLGISRKAFKSGSEKVIPTNNEFTETSGCYVSCFSKNAKDAIYPVDTNVYLMGQLRVQGQYHNGLCLPKGFESQDIRTAKEFKAKCEEAFPERCEKESCWASGNTGNWF